MIGMTLRKPRGPNHAVIIDSSNSENEGNDRLENNISKNII